MLVDETLNMAIAMIYFIFSAFGIVGATIETIPNLYEVAGESMSRVLGLVVFVSGLLAGVSALHSIGNKHWERWEFYSTATLVTFIAAHVASLIYVTLLIDQTRLSYAVVSLSFLVIPTWKIAHILRKNR